MTQDQIIAANALSRVGRSHAEIAQALGLHIISVKRHFDPLFALNMTKARERRKRIAQGPRRPLLGEEHDPRDLTGRILGDPPFERSALWQKMQRRDPLALGRR